MENFLILGFLIGMAHALEADHLAAVGALATSKKTSQRGMALLGASWGFGHTTTLFLVCTAVVAFGYTLSDRLSAGLETAVGIMLVLMGLRVLWKLYRKKVHFHVHSHEDGRPHAHAHTHSESKDKHTEDAHQHKHGFAPRAYLVGLVHGLAGSGALILLVVAATENIATALLYVLVFGLGSTVGMAILTFAVSWPLRFGEKSMGWMFKLVQMAIGFGAIYIGYEVIVENRLLLFTA